MYVYLIVTINYDTKFSDLKTLGLTRTNFSVLLI